MITFLWRLLIDEPLFVQATPTGDLDHVKLLEKYGLAYKVLSDPKQREEYAEQLHSGDSEDSAMQQMPAQIKQVLGDKEVSSVGYSSKQYVCSAQRGVHCVRLCRQGVRG